MSLFDKAEEQYIDSSGKMRMLNFYFDGKWISLMIPPSPPIDISYSSSIYSVKLRYALDFIKEHALHIDYQDVKRDAVEGLWVSSHKLKDCYIPVKSSKILKNVEFADYSKIRPLLDKAESMLENHKRSQKVAEFLKKYALYTYSMKPEKFGKSSFVVKENHNYDIENLNNRLFFENNNVFYEKGKLIVTSKKIRDKLMAYIQVQVLNDEKTVLNLKNITNLDEGYKIISDFTSFPNQLIFKNKIGIRKWKEELIRLKKIYDVSLAPLPAAREPYFYRLAKTNKIVLIQNVEKGKLELAAKVSYKWLKDRVNKGYYPFESSLPNDISYITYTDNTEIKHKKGTDDYASIFFYDNGEYAALLNFSE